MPIFAVFIELFNWAPAARKGRGNKLLSIAILLILLFALHITAMVWFEGLDPWSATWLTFITVSTVGYGDVSAKTIYGQIATLTLLILPGIALFSALLGVVIERSTNRLERQRLGQWRWNMKDHILIFNPPRDVDTYVRIVVREFTQYPEYQHAPVMVVSTKFPNGLPASLQDMNVMLYSGSINHLATLNAVSVDLAKVIVVLANDPEDADSDAATFDVIHRIRELESKAYVVAEVLRDENRNRVRKIGANATMRPIRAYPEIAVRSVLAPGSELVIEELFDSAGSEYRTIQTPEISCKWWEVVRCCVEHDFGTPLAWVGEDGNVVINPLGSSECKFKALILAVLDHQEWTDQDLIAALPSSGIKQLENTDKG